jgi:ATP-dependent Clp protease ATP-binding subunit ClpA
MLEGHPEVDYSERARQVVFLARWMAGKRGSSVIEMDDLMTALIKEDQGGFATTLSEIPQFQHLKTPPHKAYLQTALANDLLRKMDAVLPRSNPLPLDAEIPLSKQVKDVLGRAGELSAHSGKPIEPLHLLAAALAAAPPSKGIDFLKEAGITLTKVLEDMKAGHDGSDLG